jgi:hypothetical protein
MSAVRCPSCLTGVSQVDKPFPDASPYAGEAV